MRLGFASSCLGPSSAVRLACPGDRERDHRKVNPINPTSVHPSAPSHGWGALPCRSTGAIWPGLSRCRPAHLGRRATTLRPGGRDAAAASPSVGRRRVFERERDTLQAAHPRVLGAGELDSVVAMFEVVRYHCWFRERDTRGG